MRQLLTAFNTVISLAVCSGICYAQSFEWVNTYECSSSSRTSESVEDQSGFIYLTGAYSDSVDLEPSTTPNWHVSDFGGFVQKTDSFGNTVWTYHVPATNSMEFTALDLQGDSSLIIAGYFSQDSIDLAPSSGGSMHYGNANNLSLVIVSLSAQTGQFQWAEVFQGTDSSGTNATTVTPNQLIVQDNSIFVNLRIKGHIDIDPGPNTDARGSSQWASMFLKLDEQGSLIWERQISSDRTVAIIQDQRIYVAGEFYLGIDLDPGAGDYTVTSNGSSDDIFIAKWTTDGSFLDAYAIGGFGTEFLRGFDIHDGNLYMSGIFEDEVDFDPSFQLDTLDGNGVAYFVASYDTSLNHSWSKAIRPSVNTLLNSATIYQLEQMKCDPEGNVLVYILHLGTIDANPLNGTTHIVGDTNAYNFSILKLSSSGGLIWCSTFTTYSNYVSLGAISSDHLHVTGSFGNQVDFDPSTGTHIVAPYSSIDGFVLRLSNSSLQPEGMIEASMSEVKLYPNPTNGNINVITKAAGSIEFFDASGRAVSRHSLAEGASILDLSMLPIGHYPYVVVQDGAQSSGIVVRQ